MRNALFRSQTGVMISGVCGGLAEYLGIGSLYIRLVFVLLAGFVFLWRVVSGE